MWEDAELNCRSYHPSIAMWPAVVWRMARDITNLVVYFGDGTYTAGGPNHGMVLIQILSGSRLFVAYLNLSGSFFL